MSQVQVVDDVLLWTGRFGPYKGQWSSESLLDILKTRQLGVAPEENEN